LKFFLASHRKKSIKSPLILLVCLLVVLPNSPELPAVKAHSGLLLSAYDTGDAPTMDGSIGSTEWVDADTTTFGPFTAGSYTITGTLYMMNNDTTLFVAVEVNGDDDLVNGDWVWIGFDNDNGGEVSHEVGDDGMWVFHMTPLASDYFYGPSWQSDTNDGGTREVVGGAGRHSGVNHFEISHPLDTSDDAHDFSLSNDDIVGFCLDLYIDNLSYDLFGTLNNPSTYSDYQVLLPILSASTPMAPIIDGVMGSVEWDAADSFEFITKEETSGMPYTNGTIYVMNDAYNLYILVIIEDVYTGDGDGCHINFDNDDTGGISLTDGDDGLLAYYDGFKDRVFISSLSSFVSDISDGGTSEGEGARSQVGNTWYFEFSHPLNSADNSHDFSLTFGDTVGFSLSFEDMYSIKSHWPTSSPFNADEFADIFIASVPFVGMLNFHDYSNRMGSMPGVTPSSTLYFPHFDKGSSWSTYYTIVNPQTSSADIDVTYYASDGSTISTSSYTLDPGHKTGTFPPTGSGWIKVESTQPIIGMLNFHDYSNRMGSMPGMTPLSTLYFPHFDKGSSWSTFYTIVNPQSSSANIDVTYYASDGSTIDTDSYTLDPGHKTGTFSPTGSGWIKVESTQPIIGMLNFHDYSNRMGSMPGVTPSSTLYFPHFDKGSSWSTYYTIVNPQTSSADIDVTYYASDGSTISTSAYTLLAGHKSGTYPPTGSGWIKVESTQPIIGMLNFHDYSNRMGSMPGMTPLSTHYFPHFDKGSSWSTFYTIVNTQTSSADIDVTYYASDGSTISTSTYTLLAGHKTGTFPPTGSGWIKVETS